MKKIIPVVLIICGVIIGSVLVGGFLQKQQSEQNSTQRSSQQSSTNSSSEPSQNEQKSYTASEVSAHSSESDCWLIIQNNVYNVTDFLGSHPGGAQEILPYCGKEASKAFATQGGSGAHSSTADNMLKDFLIGTLR